MGYAGILILSSYSVSLFAKIGIIFEYTKWLALKFLFIGIKQGETWFRRAVPEAWPVICRP